MIAIPPKYITYLIAALVLTGIGGCVYWKLQTGATAKEDLKDARGVIKVERETKKVEAKTDRRVNAESIQTATKAQEAVREIQAIRKTTAAIRPAAELVGSNIEHNGVDVTDHCDSDCARVMQLAREARAAAVESSAKLQPARASTR